MANEFKIKKGLIVNGSGSTILDIQGSQGQLFSVTDNLSGSLFSVNDISGLPILQVSSDDSVKLGTYNAEAIKVQGSTATITGSLFGTAATASYAPLYLPLTGGTITGNVTVNGTASIAFLNVQFESASVIYSSGSNIFGDAVNDTQTLNGTVLVSGSQQITGSLDVNGGITGSLLGTASYATTALNVVNNGVTSVATNNGITGGTITSTGTIGLATAYGDTVNPYASKTANYVLAAPNGSAGVPSFRAIVAADIPTLNQNTSGNAATATTSGLLTAEDNRTISPSELAANRLKFGFTSWANNNSSPYADYLHLRSYSDGSGGNDNLVMFRKDAIGMRIWQQAYGSATAYSSYKDVAWTDGTNASGNWTINVTGSLFGTSSWAVSASFVNASTTNAFIQNGNSFGTTALLGTNDNQSLAIETSGSTRMFISSSGNVGIGTTIPGAKLDVLSAVSATPITNGIVRIVGTGTNPATGHGGGLLFTQQDSGGNYVNYASITGRRVNNAANNMVDLDFNTGSPSDTIALATRMTIKSDSGNVGIGTTTPNTKLSITSVWSNGTDSPLISSQVDSETLNKIGTYVESTTTAATAMTFYTHPANSSTSEKMRITSAGNVNIGGNYTSTTNTLQVTGNAAIGYTNAAPTNGLLVAGNVGIGTIAPAAKLMIEGDYANMDGTVSYSTNTKGIILNQNGVGGDGMGLWFRQAGLTAGIGSTRVNSGDWATDLRFYTHPSEITNQNTLYERMRINSEGNVGIGTIAPTAKLHVSSSTSDLIRMTRGSADYMFQLAGTTLYLLNNVTTTYALTVLNNGNIGIGTITPNAKLDVSGSAIITGSLTVTNGITGSLFGTSSWAVSASYISPTTTNAFIQGGNSFGTTALLGTNDNQSLALETSGSTRMFISSSGNVGIGTTSPGYKFHVVGDSFFTSNFSTYTADGLFSTDARPGIWVKTPAGNAQGVRIGYRDFGSGQYFGRLGFVGLTNWSTGIANSAGTNFSIGLGNAVGTDYVTIVSGSGNVGIGTTAPETKLHIEDVTKVLTGNVAGVAQGTLSLVSTDALAADIGPSLIFGGNYITGNSTRIAYAGIAGRKANGGSTNADGYLSFLTWRTTGLEEAMRITPAGFLALGATFAGVRFVNAGGAASSGPTLGSGYVGSQALVSENGLYGMWSGVSNNGDVWHQVQRNDGNTATYNLLFNPSGGNVGIGQSSIQGKLHVYQTTNLGGTAGNSLILQTLQNTGGSGGNNVYIKDYAVRDATGTSWLTWRHHNSIDIDGSHDIPGTNTHTFWERDPYAGFHYFGHQATNTMTIDGTNGRVGIGTLSPSERLTISGSVNINSEGSYMGIDAQATPRLGFVKLSGAQPFLAFAQSSFDLRVSSGTTIATSNTFSPVLTVKTTGEVGIGTTNPLSKLDVAINDNAYATALTLRNTNTGTSALSQIILETASNTSGVFAIRQFNGGGAVELANYANAPMTFWTSGSERMRIAANGNVGIGTTDPGSYKLYVSGTIYATGDVIAFSDESVKENIRPIENVIEKIQSTRGIIYDRIDTETKDNIGFIAQELEVAFPELVVTNEDGTKAVKYQNTVAVLFEAIKEQQKQIDAILKLLDNGVTK